MITPQIAKYAQVLDALHKIWTPHAGQIEVGKALFRDGVKRIFLQCGRRSGKSEMMAYCAIRWALTHPNAACFIIGPQSRQMREILWESRRLHRMIPPEYVEGFQNVEMRARLTNGSFIKVDGSDNEDSLRGLRMDLLAIDEYKDVAATLFDTISPALTDFDAPAIIAGTPPETEGHYTDLVKEAKESPEWRYFKLPTSANPHIKPELIEKERKRAEIKGDLDVFAREYLAEFVPGGKRAVFPFLSDAHIAPYPQLWSKIYSNLSQWEFYAALDPGTASVFAALLVAVNPYKGLVYVMDELYVTQQAENSIGKVWPQIAAKMKQVYDPDMPDDQQWLVCVDEAATWARAEILDQFGVGSIPTSKASNKKANGISLVRDLLQRRKMVISDRCTELVHEMKIYMLDKQGNYVKRDDHLIDALRYALAASAYSHNEAEMPLVPEGPDEPRVGYSPAHDYRDDFGDGAVDYRQIIDD